MEKALNWRKAGVTLILMTIAFTSTAIVNLERLHAAPERDVRIESHEAKVNVNKATLEELITVRGIGPSLAERILNYRHEHGHFEHMEDLTHIRGIGQAKLAKIKSQVVI